MSAVVLGHALTCIAVISSGAFLCNATVRRTSSWIAKAVFLKAMILAAKPIASAIVKE